LEKERIRRLNHIVKRDQEKTLLKYFDEFLNITTQRLEELFKESNTGFENLRTENVNNIENIFLQSETKSDISKYTPDGEKSLLSTKIPSFLIHYENENIEEIDEFREIYHIILPSIPPIPTSLPRNAADAAHLSAHLSSPNNHSPSLFSTFSDIYVYPPPPSPFPSLSFILKDYISSDNNSLSEFLSSFSTSNDASISLQTLSPSNISSPLPSFHFLSPPLLLSLFPKMEPPEELCEESFKKRVIFTNFFFFLFSFRLFK
jgi:hypothetical protein